jgi:hypothetical protein
MHCHYRSKIPGSDDDYACPDDVQWAVRVGDRCTLLCQVHLEDLIARVRVDYFVACVIVRDMLIYLSDAPIGMTIYPLGDTDPVSLSAEELSDAWHELKRRS